MTTAVWILLCYLPVVLEGRLLPMSRYATGITKVHNYYRNLEKASNMKIMGHRPRVSHGPGSRGTRQFFTIGGAETVHSSDRKLCTAILYTDNFKVSRTPPVETECPLHDVHVTEAVERPSVWDWALARRAAVWSENCYWGHQNKGFGENLAYEWSTGTLKLSEVILKAVKNWYNEKYYWRWSTKCGAACHYTQMVWAHTTRVGCAYSICPKLRTEGLPIKNAHYLVCFYSPPGNYYGQYPYRSGRKCSQCDSSAICRQGLCCARNRKSHLLYLPTK